MEGSEGGEANKLKFSRTKKYNIIRKIMHFSRMNHLILINNLPSSPSLFCRSARTDFLLGKKTGDHRCRARSTFAVHVVYIRRNM
jgi:hypothetical protein